MNNETEEMSDQMEKMPEKLDLEPMEVYRRVREIQKMKKAKIPVRVIEKRCADFFMSYPIIVDKTLDGTLDTKLFYKMATNAQAVRNGTQQRYATELKIGEELAEKFMFPNMTAEQKETVKQAIKKNSK